MHFAEARHHYHNNNTNPGARSPY
eukprot:COSAG01_NODE_29282_length_641_cov_0.896679_1_plen_23_part_01